MRISSPCPELFSSGRKSAVVGLVPAGLCPSTCRGEAPRLAIAFPRVCIRTMNAAARQIIAALDLKPLPEEGGYFRQTWRGRSASAILFLITSDEFSAFHRIAQDELWHFHAGDSIEHIQLHARDGSATQTVLGSEILAGQQPQLHVPARTWQGARLVVSPNRNHQTHGFALLGCTVVPPWDEGGFELARRGALLRDFPLHAALICALTR